MEQGITLTKIVCEHDKVGTILFVSETDVAKVK